MLCGAGMARAETYDVGPGHAFEAITDVPLETLGPGDIVRVHWRSEPYRERFGIDSAGTLDAPIVIRGVADEDGRRPVLDAENAIEGHAAHVRGVIHIVGDAAYVVVENFEIRNANATSGLEDNSAGIFAPGGRNLTFRNLDLHHNGNGFFSWHESSDVLVEGCHIHENGNVDSQYEHNVYTESDGITFQHNILSPLRAGALGNNLKDRSRHAVIRYNWIEGGNRCLDLVEAEDGTWSYDEASDYVYGNVMIKLDETSQSQMIHYGGDNGSAPDRQRLHLFHNTMYSDRPGNTTLLFVNAAAWVGAHNNVFHGTGEALELIDPDDSAAAVIELGANWITEGWLLGSPDAAVTGQDGLLEGADPGLLGIPTQFAPIEGSAVIDAGLDLPEALADHPVDQVFAGLGVVMVREDPGSPDLGAFAWAPEAGTDETGSTSSAADDDSDTAGTDDETSSSTRGSTSAPDGLDEGSNAETGRGTSGTSTTAATSAADTTSTSAVPSDASSGGQDSSESSREGCDCAARPSTRPSLAWFTILLGLGLRRPWRSRNPRR